MVFVSRLGFGVYGSEGYGLRQKTLVHSDFQFRVDINKNIDKVLSHGKYIMGPEVSEFEKKGDSYWLSINSGTIEMNSNKVIVLAD